MGPGFYRLANTKCLCKQWGVQRHRDAVGSTDLWPITDEVGHIVTFKCRMLWHSQRWWLEANSIRDLSCYFGTYNLLVWTWDWTWETWYSTLATCKCSSCDAYVCYIFTLSSPCMMEWISNSIFHTSCTVPKVIGMLLNPAQVLP